ncbi:MAG: DMT family transporter [Lentimicrobium sp.]|nr:DMT family transporter [Lentimicrobium sp.]MDD2528831.1 DMT family transporter [Lentimicrobiaceae bacterium]MDD4597777.1 DMT family transporter [Lentimicrobiaceae bacterium]MDY0025458.1 DMT family transporter [Lentimicrobium sp.]
MKPNLLRYYLFAVTSMFLWALTFIWFKKAVAWYEPVTIIFLRLVLASLLLYSFAKLSRQYQAVKRSDYKWFMLLALSEPFFYFIGESFGLKYVSTTISSAIIATIPLFSPLAAALFTREKVTFFAWSGIIVSFAGILLMVFNLDFSFNAEPKGIALLFLAVFSAVAYSILIKRLANKYSALTIISTQSLIGAIYFLPLFLVMDFSTFITITPPLSVILAIIQLSVFGSCMAFLLFIMVIAKLGMVKANLFTNLIPVFTAILSYFVLSEIFTVQKIIAMFLVIGGIVVAQTREIMELLRRKHNKQSLKSL